MTNHTYTPTNVPSKYQLPTPYGSQDIVRKSFKPKVTMARSKVKSRSHHDVAHLHHPTNVPTKYQLPTPYGSQDKAQKNVQTQGHYAKVKGQIKVAP